MASNDNNNGQQAPTMASDDNNNNDQQTLSMASDNNNDQQIPIMASDNNSQQTPTESQSHNGFVPSLDQLRDFARRLALRLPYLQFSPSRALNLLSESPQNHLGFPSQIPQNHLLPSAQQTVNETQQTQQPHNRIPLLISSETPQNLLLPAAQQPETETQQRRNGISMLIPLLTALAGQLQQGERREGGTHMVVFVNQMTGTVVAFEGAVSEEKRGNLPASKKSIEEMKRVEVNEENGGKECVICLEEFGVGEIVREMPCKHLFHGGCIEKWLSCCGTCPVCRYVMPVDDEDAQENKSVNSNGGAGGLTVHAFFVGGGATGADGNGGGDVEG